jgi:signal transduction histidine kinase
MSGFAQVLIEDYAGKLGEDGEDALREIQGNAEKMGSLIDALLSLSRVTRSDWLPERVDLSALFRATAARHATAEPARQVTLVVEEQLFATLDRHLATALFENLVGNAWKFTAHCKIARIELGSIPHQGGSALFVRDNGAGFDMAYAGKLFAPFQRLHSASEFPGTGIGLATVQRIVRRHGGQIWAEGKVAQGACIYFTVPELSRSRSDPGVPPLDPRKAP